MSPALFYNPFGTSEVDLFDSAQIMDPIGNSEAMFGMDPGCFGPPPVPAKDIKNRLPPSASSSSSSQLLSIKESTKEAVIYCPLVVLPGKAPTESSSDGYTTESPVRSSPRATHRKKHSISLFPDPSRLQFPASNPFRAPVPTTARPATPKTTPNSTSASDESLTGLAKARQRALEAKKRTSPDQSPSNLVTTQPAKLETIVAPEAAKQDVADDPLQRARSTSPSKLRRKLSKSLRRRSKSVDFDAGMKMSISAPLEASLISSITSERRSKEAAMPVSEVRTSDCAPESNVHESHEDDKLKKTNAAAPLLQAAEIKTSIHTRQASSVSSAEIDIEPSSEIQSDGRRPSRSKLASYTTRRPLGVSPEQAARILPSSVKTALSLHAHTESMGYIVLLPHEVVQLNDVCLPLASQANGKEHLSLEKKIDSIKKEVSEVRRISTDLHEKILDELRACAESRRTGSNSITKLLHLQIDVAMVEVKLEQTNRKLSKALQKRTDVRERLLMHLAGTHAMMECDKRIALDVTTQTPPASPVQPEEKIRI